ncbi:hypothetical protein ACGVWS_15285 [Enterobacteriaceae bacterium LUAb1]
MRNAIITLIITLTSCLLSGCTWVLFSAEELAREQETTVKGFNDKVDAVFRYSHAGLVINQQNGTASSHPFPGEGIGFMGGRNDYFFTEGGEALLQINQLAEQYKFFPFHDKSHLDMKLIASQRAEVDGYFADTVSVIVITPSTSLSAVQIAQLNNEGFKDISGHYYKNIVLKGYFIDKNRLTTPLTPADILTTSYYFSFYTDSASHNVNYSDLFHSVTQTPIKLADDITSLSAIVKTYIKNHANAAI